MPALKTLVVIGAGALLAAALGFLAYHYVAMTDQYFRLVMFG
jgi:hypothetical protein